MSQTYYDAKLATLKAMNPDDVKGPNMPVDVFLQEASDLRIVAEGDRAQLEGAGLDWATYGADLAVREGALRQAQSIWVKNRYIQEDAQRVWSERSPDAYELRNDLIHDLRFAFRKESHLLSRVNEVATGNGHADMIQDLNDLSVIGGGDAAATALAKINFDTTKLANAATMAEEMANLLSMATGGLSEQTESKDIRDRAFTHLMEAVTEIRDTGRYVFRKDKKHVLAYGSQYFRS